ncbi:MAG: NAD(P)/FAD-dependent oxidoreductase [Methanocorpusculum sp.]|nr:NAD(P)/FAD-dependent oxidoreductase [Methanocorpusculum sp.]
MYDVVIVGGGPVGSSAAKICSKAGLKTLVLEEHSSIGYPVQCAGLLSNSAFTECEVSSDSVYNTVSGAKIIGSSNSIEFDSGVTKAYVVDRGRLDFEIAEMAAESGAEYKLKTSVSKINPEKKLIHTHTEDIPYNLLIAADGPRSVCARSIGSTRSEFIYSGIQAEIPCDVNKSLVELYPNASPDFFAWMIPLSEKRARIGLCGTKNVPALFSQFKSRFTDSNVHSVTGTVPIGVRKKTFGDGVMLCGDAAGFPKPTSGGGIYTGIRSARHASAVAVSVCESGNYSDEALSVYENLWRNDFGRELDTGLKALKLRRGFTEADIDSVLGALNNPDIIETIINYGDMDKPSTILKKLITRPEVMAKLSAVGIRGLFRKVMG